MVLPLCTPPRTSESQDLGQLTGVPSYQCPPSYPTMLLLPQSTTSPPLHPCSDPVFWIDLRFPQATLSICAASLPTVPLRYQGGTHLILLSFQKTSDGPTCISQLRGLSTWGSQILLRHEAHGASYLKHAKCIVALRTTSGNCRGSTSVRARVRAPGRACLGKGTSRSKPQGLSSPVRHTKWSYP